ncbi:MAG: PDC sensor domain-containing protein [Synechococcales cyanobacterium T60_A2020_003]|nr:PDC sensor domain-containing protein [Synechococcales cyanobacterium T60_A2020_003]
MSLPAIKQFLARLSGNTPLQLILIVAFVSQLIVTVVIIGWLSLHSGRVAVTTLARQWSAEVTAQIEQQVQRYLEQPQMFHQVSVASVEAGVLDLDNLRQLSRYFWEQVNRAETMSSAYYGSATGEFVGVQRRASIQAHQAEQFVLWYADASTQFQRQTYRLDTDGSPTQLVRTQPYDPRDRPWYQVAVQAGKTAWSPVYQFASSDYALLGITTAQPVYTAAGDLRGVLAVDLTLAQISEFLHQISIGTSGVAVIMESSGELIATSTDSIPVLMGDRRAAAHTKR